MNTEEMRDRGHGMTSLRLAVLLASLLGHCALEAVSPDPDLAARAHRLELARLEHLEHLEP